MHWLNTIIDGIKSRQPDGDVLIESGSSPSGTYHLGHLRELVTADAILIELQSRGRNAKHIQFVDDLDGFRKVPVNLPKDYDKYFGVPLCDMPSPDNPDVKLADYFLQGLIDACKNLGIDVEFIRAHIKYREGFYVPAIEKALSRVPEAREALETVSGRKLEDSWSPIQVLVDGRLKKQKFVSINTDDKTLVYENREGEQKTVKYDSGLVKLDWRLDWPGRWWLQNVGVEPSGRDHMTKGGSYDTGVQIMKDVYEAQAPYPVAYDFINMVGDTKKMSASKGTGLDAAEGSKIMPAEVLRYFILRSAPSKRLYFDPVNGVVRLMDEFAEFAAKRDKTEIEQQLWNISTRGGQLKRSVSQIPFSHLVASYQASLKDKQKTLSILRRTNFASIVELESDLILEELKFIDGWLQTQAPEDVKFELRTSFDPSEFTDTEKMFLSKLADKIESSDTEQDGQWYHNTIYELKDEFGLQPKEAFLILYKALIGKESGPRAGWFLSMLPKEWLLDRLRLKS